MDAFFVIGSTVALTPDTEAACDNPHFPASNAASATGFVLG